MENNNFNPIIWPILSGVLVLIILVLSSDLGKKYSLWEDLDDKEDNERDLSVAIISAANFFCSLFICGTIEDYHLNIFKNTKESLLNAWFLSAIFCIAWTVLFYQIGRKHAKKEQKEIEKN